MCNLTLPPQPSHNTPSKILPSPQQQPPQTNTKHINKYQLLQQQQPQTSLHIKVCLFVCSLQENEKDLERSFIIMSSLLCLSVCQVRLYQSTNGLISLFLFFRCSSRVFRVLPSTCKSYSSWPRSCDIRRSRSAGSTTRGTSHNSWGW